jgi:hypothetical protein
MTIIFKECLAEEISVMEIPQVLDIFSKTITILRRTFSKEEIEDFLLELGHQIVASVRDPPRGRRSMYLRALLDVIDIDPEYHAPLMDSLIQEELLAPIMEKKEHAPKHEASKELIDIVRSIGSRKLHLMTESNQFLARLFVEKLHFEGISLMLQSIPESLYKEAFPTLEQFETFMVNISQRDEGTSVDREVLNVLVDLWKFGIEKTWRIPMIHHLFKHFDLIFCLEYLVALIEWEKSDGSSLAGGELLNPNVVDFIVGQWKKCANKSALDAFNSLFKALETHDEDFLSTIFDEIQPITIAKDTRLRWEKACQFLSFRFDRGIVTLVLREVVVDGTFVPEEDEEGRNHKMLEFERIVYDSFEKSLTHPHHPSLESMDPHMFLRSLRILCKESISDDKKDDPLYV